MILQDGESIEADGGTQRREKLLVEVLGDDDDPDNPSVALDRTVAANGQAAYLAHLNTGQRLAAKGPRAALGGYLAERFRRVGTHQHPTRVFGNGDRRPTQT